MELDLPLQLVAVQENELRAVAAIILPSPESARRTGDSEVSPIALTPGRFLTILCIETARLT